MERATPHIGSRCQKLSCSLSTKTKVIFEVVTGILRMPAGSSINRLCHNSPRAYSLLARGKGFSCSQTRCLVVLRISPGAYTVGKCSTMSYTLSQSTSFRQSKPKTQIYEIPKKS